MIQNQIPELRGDFLQAGVPAAAMVDLSLFLPVLAAILLLAVLIGLVLWRKHKEAQEEAENMPEPELPPLPSWDGTVGAEYGSRERNAAGKRSEKIGGVPGDVTGRAGRLEEALEQGQRRQQVGVTPSDPGLKRLFTEMEVRAHEPLGADVTHDDEAALREALIKAAAGGAVAKIEAEEGEAGEAPLVEAVAAEEFPEVEASPEEEPPIVEATAEEEPVVEAAAVEESSETEGIETAEIEELEVPEVAAVAAESVEAEIPVVQVEAAESSMSAIEMVERGEVEEIEVEEEAEVGAAREVEEAEEVPVVRVEPVGEEAPHAAELGEDKASEVGGAAKASQEDVVGADGQTTFFTFEDLNFQPVEDAKPGENGLGLSLEEAAAVLASGPAEPRNHEATPRMDEIFPALVNDEGPEAEESEESVNTKAAEENAAAGSKQAVGRKSRLKKITLGVPVLVRGPKADPTRLREVTQTLVVLPHGAVVSLGARVGLGEVVNLVNLKTGDEAECRVVGMKLGDDGKNQVEIEFLQEITSFWPVSFPGEAPRGGGRTAPMEPVRS